jgi:SAM-dependent methyltransferase
MRYLNPAPDPAGLGRLYSTASIDPVMTSGAEQRLETRFPPVRSTLRSILHTLNGSLRGHPRDWPHEEGRSRAFLDFGCHDGEKLVPRYQQGWNVAGIDLNEQGIAVARGRFPEGRFWCGDLLTLSIADRFDCILTDNVVEHLFDPLIYLTALVKLLKPGGELRVVVPNGAGLTARILGRYSAVYWMPFHLNLFTKESLTRSLELAGLTRVRCDTFTPIGSWTWTLRQALLRPGFNRRPPSGFDRLIQRLAIVWYPLETLAQWVGLGEELVATGQRPR